MTGGLHTAAEHASKPHARSATRVLRSRVFVVLDAAERRLTCPWDVGDPAPHPVLTWSEIAALDRRSPFWFEAHSISHPELTHLSTAAAREQICRSKSVLEERLGRQ